MKLVKFALIHCAAISVFLLAALSAQAKEDPVWGEAWNSKIGKANCTIEASSNYGSSAPVGNVFDNNVGSRYLAKSGAAEFPVDVTIVVNDAYAPETPDLVLKKYSIYGIQGDGTGRFPRDWVVYGSNDGGVTWDAVAIDSQTLITVDKYVDSQSRKCYEVDISGNVLPYRAYKFHFLHDNGGNFLEIGEIYLFGEIKAHENKILYKAEAFNGIYDGYEHGAEVTPITPNTTVLYSRTGADGSWGDKSPAFKDVGEHTIFLKLTAEGYPDALDSVKVVIEEPPRENLNITAEVRLAGGREGEPTKYREVAKSGSVGGFGDKDADVFVDGVDNQRAGWANSGTGVYDYTILDTYRPGDAVVATAVLFAVGTNNKSDGLNVFPRTFSLYGWNGEGEGEWELIAAFDDETNPAWTDAELSGSAYYRTVPFVNRKAYRKYEFQFKSRVQMSEISLIGSIGAADASAVVALARDYDGEYDGYPHGISVDVIMPEEGAKTYYRLEETQEWSETAPTFVGPVVNTEPVYWKVEAEGLEPASGVNTVTIHDAPRANLDIGATLKSASTRSTGWNYEVTATGRSTASDGNLQNIFCGINAAGVSGDRNVWTDNKPFTLTLTINPAYRPGEAVVVSAVVFHTDFSAVNPKEIKADTVTPEELLAQYGYYRLVHRQTGDVYQVPDEKAIGELPSQFKLEASKDGEHWRLLRNELEGEAWSYKDIVEYPAVGAVMFEHAYAPMLSRSGYRLFRFTFPKRTIISAIQLLGSIGLPPPGFQILVR